MSSSVQHADASSYSEALQSLAEKRKNTLKERKMSLQEVTVDKKQLIETVEKNKEIHAHDFEDTWEEYIKAFKKALDVVAEHLSKNEVDTSELNKLPKPKSYVDSYEETLELLRWEVNEQITLNRDEFQNYVLDNWHWKANFESSKSTLSAYNFSK